MIYQINFQVLKKGWQLLSSLQKKRQGLRNIEGSYSENCLICYQFWTWKKMVYIQISIKFRLLQL